MLQEADDTRSERLALGVTFGMPMKLGVRYSTPRAPWSSSRRTGGIAWKTGPKGTLERFVAGRIWRYELEPRDGGTLVRESWDITGGPPAGLVEAR